LLAVTACFGLLAPLASNAQIKRAIVNGGFEQPVLTPGSKCYVIIGSGAVPGWKSTHPAPADAYPNMYCGPNIGYSTPGVFSGGQIEIWATGHTGGATGLGNYWSMTGQQHGELNAWTPSRLYQDVCLINGETVGYAVGHRGRRSQNDRDVAELNIGNAGNTVLRASTTASGNGGVIQCGNSATGETNGPFNGATDNGVASPVCSSVAVNDGWRKYSGTFRWNGASGMQNVGFESISVAGGDLRTGNLMDEVSVTLRPMIEFTGTTNLGGREGGSLSSQPQIRVLGTVPAGTVVTLRAAGSGHTASAGDYTLGTFTIPAGQYDSATTFTLAGAIAIANDTLIEDNESVALELAPGAGYVISSTQTCGGAANNRVNLAITDNDVDVRTTKTVANANPPRGGTATFTVTYQNNTARPTTGDTTAHDVQASIADALPAGFTAFNWTCAASAGASCPAASGSGAIGANAALPAGGTLTYTVNGTLAPQQCAAATNASTIALTSADRQEGTAAQAGFATPAPGGTANNTASASVDPGCLTLTKTTTGNAGGPFTFALTNTSQATGTATTASAGTAVTVDGDTTLAGSQPYGIVAANSGITITETAAAGFALSSATCTNGGTAVGALAGTTYTIPAASVSGGADFVCAFTNASAAAPQLTITKTATPGAFAVGQPASYALAVGNTGNAATSGTIQVTDPLPAGITAVLPITAAGWDCAASTTTQVNCASGTVLPAGSNAPSINITVAIAPGTASPAVNTATVEGGGDAACPAATARCTSTTSTPVNAPRLDVTKALDRNLVVGVPANYLIQVTNGGTSNTLTGIVTDTIPTGLAIGAVSNGCVVSGRVVTCNLPAGLTPGQSISFTVAVTPEASSSGQTLTNSATASGGGDATCPQAAHCTGTTTDTVSAPQLSLTKTATPNPFVIDTAAAYTLTLTNTGTAATTAATTITDTIPDGLTIGAPTAGCTLAGRVITCTVAAPLATQTPVAFVIPVTPQASLAGLSVTNNATATGGGDPSCTPTTEPLPARCIGTTTTPVNAPRLDIVKTASDASFVVGVAASYTLQVESSGTAATTQTATVTDVVPAGLVIDSAPGCAVSGQTVTCDIAAPFAVGATASFTINVTPAATTAGRTLTNTATVRGGGDPTCPADAHCSSTVTTPVNGPQLTIEKTANAERFVVGTTHAYTLSLTNTGTTATTATATVTDNVPSTLTLGLPPAGCTNSGQVVTCTIAAGFAVNATTTFVIPVTPTQDAASTTVVNTAIVSGGGDPTCPADTQRCSSTVTVYIDIPPS
jgi:uncharacterized repeat protein (TIGR01451 family)